MLSPEIQTELSKKEQSKLHRDLLSKSLAWVDHSRRVMSRYYCEWDEAFEMYDATNPDKRKEDQSRRADKRAREEERPKSQSIPITYSQVQTFKAFATQLLSQREKHFEFKSIGSEDEIWRDLGEDLVQADCERDKWVVKRGQFITQMAITGIGVLKSMWREEQRSFEETIDSQGQTAFGRVWGALKGKKSETITLWKGTKTDVLSPYRFFPDPAVPLSEFQEGRFVASEHEFSRNELYEMQRKGEVAGVEHIDFKIPDERWTAESESNRRLSSYDHTAENNQTVVVTELQMKIIPNQFKLNGDDKPIGEGDQQMILNVWIANDQRVIKAELMNYLHGEFTYDVAVFDTEKHSYVRKAITTLVKELQTTADWFLNSRMESVSRNIEPQLVADPIAVDISRVKARDRIIPLRKGAARAGIDRFIKQLQTSDPTLNHNRDIQDLLRLVNLTTGVSDNMMGQYHPGRRSATESKVVASGSSARAVMIIEEMWIQAFASHGNKRLKNLRQGLTADDVKSMVGDRDAKVFKAFKATPREIARHNDLFVYDGTTQSEKSFLAQSLQELLSVLISNPDQMVNLNLSPRLILEKIFELRGLNFRKDIALDKDDQQLQQIIQQQAMQLATNYIAQLQQQQTASQNGPENAQ